MSDKTVPITIQGKIKLEEELKFLKTIERPKVIEAIATARAHGDLSENAEYHAAREKQSFVEGRIKELEDAVARSQAIDPKNIKTDKIVFGATVQLRNTETEEVKTYTIVGVYEAIVKEGKISIESPIARTLLGKKVSDTITLRAPKGDIEYEILNIAYE